MPELPFDAPRRWAVARTDTPVPPAETSPVPYPRPVEEKLELFQAAAAQADDGYARWRAEAAAARKAEEAARRAVELPVAGDGAGYAAWKAETDAARLQFEQRWGVPLGKLVRVQLRGELHEREGSLHLADEPSAKPSRHLQLRLGSLRFSAAQIESLVRL